MSDRLVGSLARLEQLLKQIMKEPDPMKYDELGAEIWRVLKEREHLQARHLPQATRRAS